MERLGAIESASQDREIGLGQFRSPSEQSHREEETSVGKKGPPQLRHGGRIREGDLDGEGKDADPDQIGPV